MPERNYDHYVALGDSFTAGPLIPPTALIPCARTTRNYPRILAARLGVALTDVSCSSARTEHMANPQAGIGGTAPPQFDALRPDTDLVTLGIGGNDGGLFGTLIDRCPELAETDPQGSPCRDEFTQGGVDLMAAKITKTKADVLDVLDGIRERSPEAEIAVVGYLRLMPETGSCTNGAVPMTSLDMLWADEIQRTLNTALAEAAAEKGARYVDTYGPSRGHDACAGEDAWVQGKWIDPLKAMEYHPFASGMEASAKMVYETLFGVDLARHRPVQASGTEHGHAPSAAVDHDTSTRWASGEWADGAWLQVDLGEATPVDRVVLGWEAAYAQGYRIDVSDDGRDWRTVWRTINGDGGRDTAGFTATSVRFVRVTAERRATRYGVSLWDLEVYGPAGSPVDGGPIDDGPVDDGTGEQPAEDGNEQPAADAVEQPVDDAGEQPAQTQPVQTQPAQTQPAPATATAAGRVRATVLASPRPDRLRVRLADGSATTVRLAGVRAPRPSCLPVARKVARKQLSRGTRVVLVRSAGGDRHYVQLRGKDVGKRLVRAGLLRVAGKAGRGDFERRGAYVKAQRAARAQGRGTWGRC
ncbi:GDSL-type esterase/lipase family protein [Nocardioides solisilvae]|uniref:GDSL-type esterase/lipase family protein n=1 Tax=Nocardioides solisilvae TaxID=1542435 RepID=UPI001EF63914|nr:GDSL-type esterase/lipase family protein [Nocardioides solisilvae]